VTISVLKKLQHCLSPETINTSRTRVLISHLLLHILETIELTHTYTPRSHYWLAGWPYPVWWSDACAVRVGNSPLDWIQQPPPPSCWNASQAAWSDRSHWKSLNLANQPIPATHRLIPTKTNPASDTVKRKGKDSGPCDSAQMLSYDPSPNPLFYRPKYSKHNITKYI